jgi:hypothetical protein
VSLLRTSNIFDAIEMNISDMLSVPLLHIHLSRQSEMYILTLDQARKTVFDPEADEAVREGIWRQVVGLVQEQRGGECEPPWQLITVWMVIPALRGTASRLFHRFRVDRSDVQSEMLLAFIEAVHSVDPGHPDLGAFLCRKACSGGWRVRQRVSPEAPVEDIDLAVRSLPAADSNDVFPQGHVRSGGLRAQTSNPASPTQVEGERLGALAHRLGLDVQQRASGSERRVVGHLPLRGRAAAPQSASRNAAAQVSRKANNQ